MVVPEGATHRHTDGRYFKRDRANKWLVYREEYESWFFELYVSINDLEPITREDI